MTPEPAPRLRLTDQALVAVTAARQTAAARGDEPTAGDLLVGLAAEADGHAGVWLRARGSAATRLVDRVSAGPPGLPALDTVVQRAGAGRRSHAIPTQVLLTGALEAGGAGVAELLAACGYDPSQLYRQAETEPVPSVETFGLGSDPDLTPDAATAVARVRAIAGGAVDLVVSLARTPAGDRLLALDADELTALRSALCEAGSSHGWDHGLDIVLDTVRAWRQAPLTVDDLLRAAVSAGGEGPRRLVEESARRATPEEIP